MKVANTGNTYEIYDDSLRTYDKLPAQNYVVKFSKMSGFYLMKYPDIEIKEKLYGVHEEKVEKVINSFENYSRNLGVILSGDKGIGKSLFAKLLANKIVEKGIPVIVVDSFYTGIASYLESIEQEVMVVFDEFDKTFGDVRSKENETDAQASMLTLFDGVSQGKKLFVITCNSLNKLSSYLVNRPGRFHYHFRFEYPSEVEVREYLTDKINHLYYPEIDKVVAFSKKVNLNFDCLRSIAFELNLGLSFEEAIKDLNIINTELTKYNVILSFTNGTKFTARDVGLNLFSGEDETVYMYNSQSDNVADITFNTADCIYDFYTGCNSVDPSKIRIEYFGNDAEVAELKKLVIESVTITRKAPKNIHYMI